MFRFIIITLLAIQLADLVAGISFGKCPSAPVVPNFNLTRYQGRWYEIQRAPLINTLYEIGLTCVTAEYTRINDVSVKVNNTGIISILKIPYSTIGTATIPNLSEPAKLIVKFTQLGFIQTSGNYWVIDTDYDSYSLVYSCSNVFGLGIAYSETTWFLSRTRTLNQTRIDYLKNKLKSFTTGFNNVNFVVQNQTNC